MSKFHILFKESPFSPTYSYSLIFRYPHSGSFVKCTEVSHGNKFVEALKEQYDYDVVKTREDYENSMKDFPVAVFDFANLEKVKRLQGLVNFSTSSVF